MGKLSKLKKWLTLPEAADYLSRSLEEVVAPDDVLRLSLDGVLPISVYFVNGATVLAEGEEEITTLWGALDLVMDDVGRLLIEEEYQRQVQGYPVELIPFADISLKDAEGTTLRLMERHDDAFITHHYSESPEVSFRHKRNYCGMWELPMDSFFVVQTAALSQLCQSCAAEANSAPAVESRLSLNTRERTTLLTIIAALAGHAGVDVSQPSKAGGTIEKLTEELGARVAARTIEEHLKRIPEALERRSAVTS